ncbi:cytochrome P450 [Mycobacterium sp.]|uniref:cytochrome P450 n=1 Tax=Mycobacterium sp. TaxID=1785 RepID=UPI00120CC4DF|nr:cytochrome P450 [Mycobacterium sp.]TAM73407.1 MAG: cytochrome P450 [Mycobacterium sp.]
MSQTEIQDPEMGLRLTRDASDPRFYMEANRQAYLGIHRDCPIYWVDARYTQPFWNVCRHDLIREVGNDVEAFTTEFGVHLNGAAFTLKDVEPQSMMQALPVALRPANIMDAASHRRLRTPLNRHFRPTSIARMSGAVRHAITTILDAVEENREVDLVDVFASRVPLLVTTELLGVSTDREHDFAIWANTILESFEPGATPDFDALADMVAFFTAEVDSRQADPREGDLMSALIQSDFQRDEVVMWCWLLLVAGLETTGNLIAGGVHLLLRDLRNRDRLVREPQLVRSAVAEMLRVITPGRYIRRTATVDIELGGQAIKKGDAVVMNFTAANFDPEMFTNPLEFDLDRNPDPHLSFSWGPHRCVGQSLALLESVIAFEEFLARFPNSELRGEAIFRPSLATAVVESLPVVFKS